MPLSLWALMLVSISPHPCQFFYPSADIHVVQYLPLADQVVVLSATDSTIQIGSFEEVRSAGLVNFVEQETREEGPEETVVHSLSDDFDKSIIENDEARDLLRQTGDFALYNTYFKAAGFLPVFTFIMFVILCTFCSSFSRELTPTLNLNCTTNLCF